MKLALIGALILITPIALFGQSRCPNKSTPRNRPLEITLKPPVSYPPEVQANVQGTVSLRVEFLAKGTIGRVSVIKGLPYGLTEVALKAARGIKFKPEIKECEAIDKFRPITFSFHRY